MNPLFLDGDEEQVIQAQTVLSNLSQSYQKEYKEKLGTDDEIEELAFLYESGQVSYSEEGFNCVDTVVFYYITLPPPMSGIKR